MAITTVDGLIAGFKTGQWFQKSVALDATNYSLSSMFYTAGIPGAAIAPTPGISGAALTSYAGQIPFTNPSAGQNTYLARFLVGTSSNGAYGTIILCDRLWHNSGITINSGSAQTINSVAFPARDNNGTTNGEGVLVGLEFSSAGGANTPTITISYTNSAGTSGRTATNLMPTQAIPAIGRFYPMKLEGSDKGVRSIQTLTFSGTGWGGGTAHLVAYRILQTAFISGSSGFDPKSPLTTGLTRLYDNTVPFMISQAFQSSNFIGFMSVTQG